MALQSFTKTFNLSVGSLIKGIRQVAPINCGLPSSLVDTISNRYVVTINSKSTDSGIKSYNIYAYLQEKITFTCASNWDSIGLMFGGMTGFADTVFQMGTGHSLQSTVASRRKWTGSDPVKISMKLKFEAIDDVDKEVLTPCRALQQLTLPRTGVFGGAESFFLIPPGPSPYKWKETDPRGDFISINIGNFMFFESVIVTNVEVVYDNRMSNVGPIGAHVNIQLETYQILTKEHLENVYSTSGREIKTGGVGQMQGATENIPGGANG